MIGIGLITMTLTLSVRAEQVSLQAIVTPSTTILKDGRVVTFAVHGFIEFKSLAELFPYIESQTRRWPANGGLDHAEQQRLTRRPALMRSENDPHGIVGGDCAASGFFRSSFRSYLNG